jgi:hypothetical protein
MGASLSRNQSTPKTQIHCRTLASVFFSPQPGPASHPDFFIIAVATRMVAMWMHRIPFQVVRHLPALPPTACTTPVPRPALPLQPLLPRPQLRILHFLSNSYTNLEDRRVNGAA